MTMLRKWRDLLGRRIAKNQSGESLAETLIAILICSLAFVLLCTAVITAGNINDKAREGDTAFKRGEMTGASVEVTIHVDGVSDISDTKSTESLYSYETSSGHTYYYYG